MVARVDYSEHFTSLMEHLSETEQEMLGELTIYIEENGLSRLPGRNKSSDHFPKSFLGVKRLAAEEFVKEHSLWHYHVGYLKYKKTNKFGDWTSEYVVHYQKLSPNSIRFVHYSSHFPHFRNPLAHHLI